MKNTRPLPYPCGVYNVRNLSMIILDATGLLVGKRFSSTGLLTSNFGSVLFFSATRGFSSEVAKKS